MGFTGEDDNRRLDVQGGTTSQLPQLSRSFIIIGMLNSTKRHNIAIVYMLV